MSQEFVKDPEFRAHLTDALVGARHLHSIGHVLILCLISAAISLLHIRQNFAGHPDFALSVSLL